jgi:hypothetical protein
MVRVAASQRLRRCPPKAAARLWLTACQVPACAPELNPVEAVWSHLKRSLANLAKRNLSQLAALVKTRLKPMQYRPRRRAGGCPSMLRTSGRPMLARSRLT